MNRTRIVVLGLIPFLFFLGLFYRLVDLQIIHHEKYLRTQQEQLLRVHLLEPIRGQILDHEGKILADNKREYRIYVVPGRIREPGAFQKKISRLIEVSETNIREEYRQIVEQIDRNVKRARKAGKTGEELQRYERRQRHRRFVLLDHLSYEEIQKLRVRSDEIRGVSIQKDSSRRYYNGALYGSLVGYIQPFRGSTQANGQSEYKRLEESGFFARNFREKVGDRIYRKLIEKDAFRNGVIGRQGIEKSYDRALRGTYGANVVEYNPNRNSTNVIRRIGSERGANIQLTVRTPYQRAAKKALGDHTGSITVMDLSNAEIVAMYSSPSYDPNRLISPVSKADVEEILQSDSPRPILHRAYSAVYPPGSVFKIVTAIAGLETGAITVNESLHCGGRYQFKGHEYRCWISEYDQGEHGDLQLHEALQRSCNVYFYKLVERIGFSELHQWAEKLAFGEATGVQLPYEQSGRIPEYREEIMNVSIGQGSLLVTPLQILQLVTVVASDGALLRPRITERVQMDTRSVPVRSRYLEEIRKGMKEVVHTRYGTAYQSSKLRSFSFDIAGKTSTAQVSGDQDPHAWFVGYFPASDPEYAFTVMLEHAGSGGENAAPVAAKFISRFDSRMSSPQ